MSVHDYYAYDPITKDYHPAKYPGKSVDVNALVLPDDVRGDYSRLNSIIETKYTREFLKICAFYNKMFPSLKSSNWVRTSYNVPPFTILEQERTDTGTGISSNYLKQIIDQVVARIGTVSFDPVLLADVPTLEYVIYKDEVERLLRKAIRDEELSRITLEVFHDAAILGYGHVLIDPVTQRFVKVNDYELGMYESQYNRGDVRQALYRDYAFPVTSLAPYIISESKEVQKQIIDSCGSQTTVDFKLYMDCPSKQFYITINSTTLTPRTYPFDKVQMVTFSWDIGFNHVTSTSLFDLLYPCQRELNKISAKVQQMIRLYKGATPVFQGDCDLVLKALSNGSGEALYVSGPRPITEVLTVINPTPLDPAMSAEITARKTEMYELAGIQQMSFDMENMRSAAAVIALDQTRDNVFQAQLDGMASFVKRLFRCWVNFQAVNGSKQDQGVQVDWKDVKALLDNATIELKPVHLNDPLGNKGTSEGAPPPDFMQMQTARAVINIYKGTLKYEDMSYLLHKDSVKAVCAALMIRLDALGIPIPDNAVSFMISAFIDDVQNGVVELAPEPTLIAPGINVGNDAEANAEDAQAAEENKKKLEELTSEAT